MKITNVTFEGFRWNRPTPIRNGKHTYDFTGIDVVNIETDVGISGIGLIGGVHEGPEISAAIVNHFKQYLIGQDPLNNELIWDAMWEPKLIGRRGLSTRVISGIDIALWDIKGKAANMPLYKLLGGFSSKAPVYIAGGYYEDGKGLKELAEEMETSVSLGARAIKMKIGGAPINEDVERVRIVRESIGPEVKLMVDANCAYKHFEAIEIARKMEPYDVYWFEEPILPDDYKGHQIIGQSTTIPIATGENEYTRYGFRDLIENRCASIIQPDALIMGGVTEFMKVSALAQSHDLTIAPHGNQQIHVHLVCAIPNGLTVEYYRNTTDPMWGNTYLNTLQVEDGFVSPPNEPGLGIELNYEALNPHRVI